jgi:hypothetical protein
MDRHYIEKQTQRYLSATTDDAAMNCLWRIASNADLIDGLNPSGHLTCLQQIDITNWLNDEGFLG